MRKSFLFALSLLLIGIAGSALAAKPEKSTILHCGCAYDELLDEASMVYSEINVSHKSRGHDAHLFGTVDACYTGTELVFNEDLGIDEEVETTADFVRTGDDCQLDGPPLGDPIGDCPVDELTGDVLLSAGDPCGEENLTP